VVPMIDTTNTASEGLTTGLFDSPSQPELDALAGVDYAPCVARCLRQP
jgi:hypothetical protein